MLYVALGLLMLVSGFAFFALRAVNRSSDTILQERLALAQTVARNLDGIIANSASQLEMTASLLFAESLANLSSHEESMLQATIIGLGADARGIGEPFHVYLTDAQRRPLWEWDKPGWVRVEPDVTAALLDEVASNRITVIKAIHLQDELRSPALVFAVPVTEPGGEVRGVLTASVVTRPSNRALFVASGGQADEYRLELVDTDGIVIASSDEKHVGQPSRHLSIGGDLFRERSQGVWKHGGSASSDAGDHIVALVPLETVPWTVALEQDEDVALGLPSSLRGQILLLSAIGILVGLLLAGITTRQVVRPLTRLTETAGRIASGDLSSPVPIEGQDEVRTLAHSFEVMRQRTAQTLDEVSSLLKVAQAVEESPDLNRVLPAVLDSVLDATTAEVAEVWLFHEQEDAIVLHHHQGRDKDAFTETGRLALGEGYPGIVAQSGESMISHDLASDTRFVREGVKAKGYSTFSALPLRRAGRTIGVLSAASRDPNALTREGELRLLTLIADHIAVAVENARLHEEVQTLAILTERDRLAREMHDGLGQVLGYVSTKAQAVKELIKTGNTETAMRHMEQLEAAAQETYDDVRESILALGSHERHRPFLDSLEEYVHRFSEMSGLPAGFSIEGTPWEFNPGVEVQVLRIAQEALSNARKHAHAQRVEVRMSYGAGDCRMIVEDDGIGFDPNRPARGPWPHLGLRSMEERAALIGARLTIDTAMGRGTK